MQAILRSLRKVPCAGIAAGAVAGILAAEGGWSSAFAIVPVVAGAVLLGARRWQLAAGFLAIVVLWAIHGTRLERMNAATEWVQAQGRAETELVGTVLSLRDGGGFLPRAVFRVGPEGENPAALRQAVLGARGLPGWIQPGDRLSVRGRLVLPARVRNPGEFDRRQWMRDRGLAAELRAVGAEKAGPPAKRLVLHRLAWKARSDFRERIVAGLDADGQRAAVIRGLVLGDRSGGDRELYEAFRKSGTMHVFAVSGLHVGLVGLLGWMVVRGLRVPRSAGLWFVLFLMWGYAFVTGIRPPALRAALMASIFLSGFALKRRPLLANTLLASLPLVLVLDSFQLGQVGFQLSYVVVGTIIVLAPLLYRRLAPFVEEDPFFPTVLQTRTQRWMRSSRRKVAGLFVVSLTAWFGSMLLIGAHFGIVTPAAVVASMVLVPVVFVILSVALVGIVVGFVASPLEEGANRANGYLAAGAFHIAEAFMNLPGSHFELRGRDGWRSGLLVFDLWGGDGAVFCGAGEGILIDAGGEDEFYRVVGPALEEAGRHPRSLVATHPDGGHVGGLLPAMESYSARQLLLPVREAGSPAYRRLLAEAEERGARLEFGETGFRYPVGDGAHLVVLRAAPQESGGRADDRGMVLRLDWRGWRILLTGDAGFDIERDLLERGADLRSDLWIMGRHGSDATASLEFVQAVDPKVIVAGEDSFPETERIPERWSAAVRAAGIDLWRQSETGAVMIEVHDETLELRSFVDQQRRTVLERGSDPSTP